jgi:hypothetical protein
MSWFVEKLYRYEIESQLSEEDRKNPYINRVEEDFQEVIISLKEVDKEDGESTDTPDLSSQ